MMDAVIVNNGRKGARLGPEHALQICSAPGLGAVGGGTTTPCALGRQRHHRALATRPGGALDAVVRHAPMHTLFGLVVAPLLEFAR